MPPPVPTSTLSAEAHAPRASRRASSMTSKWTSNANEATSLRLVGAPPPCDGVFHPEFTYPIFGDAETIYGYSDLHIRLSFASGRLTPALDVSYKAKNTTTAAKIDDVRATMLEYLPKDEVVTPDALQALAAQDTRGGSDAFRPHGERVATYTRTPKPKARSSLGSLFSARSRAGPTAPREFHIYHATWDTPGFREWHARAQILTLFFIEGASYIQGDEPNWEFYTVFERVQTEEGEAFHLVGFTSLYRFWCWPGRTRLRLSQFLILPPFQKQRHGAELYNTVFDRMLADPDVCELTIEDPSEAFDGLRDACDLARLSKEEGLQQAIADGRLRPPIERAWSDRARAEHKMAPRQWSRMLEILALKHLDQGSMDLVRAYRLQLKARLFRVNREVLSQLSRVQRLEKLQETFESVVDEYAELSGVELTDALLDAPELTLDAPPELPPMAKRAAAAVIEHADDDDDDDGEPHKRARVQ